jgi:anaerobic selenocysteine-containing dehydrogenase
MASAVSGYKLSFGSDGPPGSYKDMEIADVILLIGANIADNHPILCQRLERNKNRTLIVVDPRVTKTAMMSDIHLPVKPRSDIALINGIAHILIRDGLIDHDYIARHTTGLEEFRTFVSTFTPQHVAEVTGLTEEQILQTAHLYGKAKAAFIGWTMGVNHSTQGAVTVITINNLALITGNIGRAGASPFSITGQCNAMGTRETGFASSLPGYRKFNNPKDREDLARLWNLDVDRIPTARGLAYPDMIEGAVTGSVKALWFIATNPAVSFPNYSVLEQLRPHDRVNVVSRRSSVKNLELRITGIVAPRSPLFRDQLQPRDPWRLRPHLPRTQLQTVRRPGRTIRQDFELESSARAAGSHGNKKHP